MKGFEMHGDTVFSHSCPNITHGILYSDDCSIAVAAVSRHVRSIATRYHYS
jgi:hypothetical protein